MKSLRSSAPWLLAAIVLVRLPGLVFHILGIDDSDFTVIARAMARGAVPYRDVVDIKPPLAFALYLPNAWFGQALWPVQVEALLVVLLTALLLGRAARLAWGSEAAAVAAAILSLMAGLCEGATVSTELLMNLPTAAGLWLFARAEADAAATPGARARDHLLGGACLGLASLIRHQAVFSLGALGLATILLGLFLRRRWLVTCALLSIGFALPWLSTLAIFQALGALPDFLDWVIVRNLRYVGQGAGSAALRLLQSLLVCLLAAAPLAWWAAISGGLSALREARTRAGLESPGARLRLAFALLLVVTWIPVSLGGRFYEHYFLQFVPPVALLGAGPFAALLADWKLRSKRARVGLTLLLVLPALGSLGYGLVRGALGTYPLQNPQVRELGAWVRGHSAPDARLFVWGHFSPIYLAAERLPGTRYLTTSWHLGNFDPGHLDDSIDLRKFRSDRDVRRTLDDLAAHPPALVIDTAPADIHSWHRLPLLLVPELESAIEEGWVEVARPGGARVLERRPNPARDPARR